jgi:non-ribosomal peptide synthetase component E (peptide arylation enzyme)
MLALRAHGPADAARGRRGGGRGPGWLEGQHRRIGAQSATGAALAGARRGSRDRGALPHRLKDVIKTGGEWLSSLQLEDLIARIPGVAEVAVIGLPDERWGERPVALVVRRDDAAGAALTAGQVREHRAPHVTSGEIVRYAVPERIEFVAALARTSVGKIDKKARGAPPGSSRRRPGSTAAADGAGAAATRRRACRRGG